MTSSDEIAATIAILCEQFPRCFVQYERRRKPLKIGIHTDLLQVLDGAVAPLRLGRALQTYVSNPFYLRACVKGAWRYDLAGVHVGEIDE